MNILLMTSPEPRISPFSTNEKRPPLGVGSLISVLKNAGHRVHFSDEYLRSTNILEKNFLIENKIDYAGLYMDSICYEGGLQVLEKIKQARKRGWKGKIMVGGPHASVKPEGIPDYVDFIVMGEGERAILDIVEGKVNGRIVTGKRIQNLDSLPMPAWEEFVKLPYNWGHEWINSYPVFTLNTSRGCPFNCNFCSVKAIWGKTYRMMSAKRVFEDMQYLKNKYGAQCIYFREDNFTLNKKRITMLCDLIIENNLNINWMCETRADSLQDPEFVSLMAQAGCKAFYIGVESGSQRMLDFIDKGETVQQFVKAFDNAHKAGIKTYASLIFGLPTETKEDVQLTEKLIKRIKPDFIGRNIFVALPGSELYDYVKENNLHEYAGKNSLLYLKGHNKRVNKYYGRNPYHKIPGTSSEWEFRVYDFVNKVKNAYKTFVRVKREALNEKCKNAKIKEESRKIPDIVLFDTLKALKEAEKGALFFTLDKNLCDEARKRGFNCRSTDGYVEPKDLEFKIPDYELSYEWLSKLAVYDGFNLGLLMPDMFINLEGMQKFRVYKILRELIDKEKPESIKVVTKGKPMYRWSEVGDTEIPVGVAESMADNKGIDYKLEIIGLTTPIKNKLFRLAAPFLLSAIERFKESIIRIKRGNISKKANAKVILFLHSNKNWHVIEPVLKHLGKHGVELLIIIHAHGFFNFGLSKKEYKHLQDLGEVRSFESYQNKSIYKIVKREEKRLKKDWNEIKNDNKFHKEFRLGDVTIWKAFTARFWFYYRAQFPRTVKYIETGKRILEIEEPEVVVFTGDAPVPSRTFETVAEKFQVPTIVITHGILFPTRMNTPKCKHIAVWAPKFKEYVILRGLDAQQVTVTGAPHYDALTKLGSKEDLRKELGLPVIKLIVTFAGEGFGREQITRKLTYEVLRSIKELNEVLLVIKPHPREKTKIYRKLLREFDTHISSDKKVMLMPGVNIGKLIKASDLLLAVRSTVALEANVIGTPVATLNFTEEKDPFYSQEGGAIGVERPEALTDTIYKALYDEKFKEKMFINRKEFLQKYTFNEDGRATERAANLVMQVMEESKRKK